MTVEDGTQPRDALLRSRAARRAAIYLAVGGAVLIGVYLALPQLGVVRGSLARLDSATPVWLAVALAATTVMFACYLGLFAGVVGGRFRNGADAPRLGWRAAYELGMASLAATTLLTAGGAGGIALMLWGLRKAGAGAREAASRVASFLMLLYAVYLGALVLGGVLLWVGVTQATPPTSLTLLPAAVAAVVIAAFLALARFMPRGRDDGAGRRGRLRAAAGVAAEATRDAVAFTRHRRAAGRAVLLALGYWAANVATLWACLQAFGQEIPLVVLIQAFFIGMTASLIPLLPGGVGTVEGGLLASFVAFGQPAGPALTAILVYRLIGFWLPTIPEVAALIPLRRDLDGRRARSG